MNPSDFYSGLYLIQNFPYLKEWNLDIYDSDISNFEAQIVYKFQNK